MEKRRLVLAFAALLTVAALGFVATGIDDGATSGGGDAGDGATGSGATTGGQSGNETVATALVAVLVVLAVGGIAYAAYRDRIPRWLLGVLIASVLVLLLLLAAGQLLEPGETDATPTPETPSSGAEAGEPSAPSTPAAGGEPGALPTPVVLGLLGLLVVGGALAVTRFSRDVRDEQEAVEPDDSTAVAEAAGRAADELAKTTLSNAVFRAWQEMTDALDVDDPGTMTPAEFEEIAVEAGLDREDVATLTDLFREVRYGDAPATAEREERARTALRHIEETYTGRDDEGDGKDAKDSEAGTSTGGDGE
jgi:hypothetical protein